MRRATDRDLQAAEAMLRNDRTAKATITGAHCQACGQLNPAHDEGYTSCCNQRRVAPYQSAVGPVGCDKLGCSHDGPDAPAGAGDMVEAYRG